MTYQNLAEMFFRKRKDLGSKSGYMYKKDGSWISITWKDAVDRAENLSAGLASLGVKKGDKVAIISGNRVEWALTDYATCALGAVLVPIYPSLLKEQVKYILNDSESMVVVVSDEIQMEKVDGIKKELKTTKHFYVLDSVSEKAADPWYVFESLAEKGKQFLKENKDYVTKSISEVKPEDWSTIIYTSGTTGEPKGAILTHKNFISNVEDSTAVLKVYQDDILLSFLPLSHVLERMAGHYLSCYYGATVAYAESIDTVAENMGEIKPTLMVAVPRLYEKMYGRVLENVEMGSPLKRKIFYWALKVGKEYINKIMDHQPIPSALQFKRNLAYKLVFHKLSERVGGRLRFFISGGAPLSADIAEFFGAAGIYVLEGYGLTETSPVISVNTLEKFRFGTVGPVIPNVEVKIADDGEILTRGNHVMVGYYKKEADTKEAIEPDGWFHTGDIGLITDEGMLKITDRKKNIIVTSGGKNIAPQMIENLLITCKYIEQSMVVGDKRKFCTAVIVCAEEPLAKWAKSKNLKYKSYEELINLPGVHELLRAEIDKLSSSLASYETIKKIFLAPALFSIDTGELTPSLKVKRKVVEEKYRKEIDQMYVV